MTPSGFAERESNQSPPRIAKLVAIPNFILGSPKIPANTLQDALAYARQRPGQLNYQAPLGSYSHLDMLALTAAAGVKMVHLPSKGAGETLPAMLRGDVHITESNVASNIGAVKAGQIKAYAVTAEQRLIDMPEVPTMAEAGFSGIGSLNWNGFFAPARTPEAVTRLLNAEVNAALGQAEVRERLTTIGLDTLTMTQSELADYIKAEVAKWGNVIKTTGITPR